MTRKKLNWMLVAEEFTEEEGALMPDRTRREGLAADVAEGEFYEIWPTEDPDIIAEVWTLSLHREDDIEELGRFETTDEAKEAAEQHHTEEQTG